MKKSLIVASIMLGLISCNSNNMPEETATKIEESIPLREVKPKKFFIDQIKNDSSWFYLIVEKAKQQNISVDEMLVIDATYIENRDAEIVKIENDIIRNPEWLNIVKQKAIDQKISLDDMIRADASYMFEESKKDTISH